ncbi:transporter substrate-binding domain-containing protein [Myxococcota bacterium]|nr:transporter substrate-binding domain-containing protein [Myxococcota bacterium]
MSARRSPLELRSPTPPRTAVLVVALVAGPVATARADLPEVQKAGVLRHLGVPYANFVTGAGDGMDVELMQRFAAHLGVRYEGLRTDWSVAIGELTGRSVEAKGDDIEITGRVPIRGDVIANGMTVLPWRRKAVAFGAATFPNQVWLVARADSPLEPIKPTNDLARDVAATKALIRGKSLLGKAGTCLDPTLYAIDKTGAKPVLFTGGLNEVAPALLNGEAEVTLLDVPDALVALEKWPGQLKVIGPISELQQMAPAFAAESPLLRKAFAEFLAKSKKDGTYLALVRKYYPFVFDFFPEFFADAGHPSTKAR